ncbi:MAG: hypothetical protein D6807_03120 [Alphaproteobacteria bacterium]|nr:MAG: hypothetical protein D6807_03120 [Alphaproteobacteria bacterium]
MALVKVTMNISERDRENAEVLSKLLNVRSKAQVVSTALELLRFLAEARAKEGAELLLRRANGEIERVIVPELLAIEPAGERVESQGYGDHPLEA